MREKTTGYADAIVEIARAEDALEAVEDELLRIARQIRRDQALYRALSEQSLPLQRRLELIGEILGRAHPVTRTALSLLIAADRLRDVEEIATAVAERAVGERGKELAEVWVAQQLSDEQKDRLRAGLESVTGKQIELKVFVDERVVGGVRAKVGDTVIDGSVAERLQGLRSRLGG